MASRKKSTTEKLHTTEDMASQMTEIIEKEPVVIEEKDVLTENEVKDLEPEEVVEVKAPIVEVKPAKKAKKTEKVEEKIKNEPKYPIGSIVFISKEADADLNGFKLFPQYKKCTYTVEAYDEITGVYSLRRLNLSLRLKEELILAPSERAHDAISKKQF